ncbi:MAG TPA: glycosyltransferase [Flavobacteriaceae bacterium]|nr:glycosyltransferase [Flavobacteriaceae bacterium]
MTPKKKHIVFIIPSLAAGGAERIFAFLAQHLDASLFNVTLVVIGFEKDNVYTVTNVKVVYLNKAKVSYGTVRIFKFLKKEKPDIVVSAIVHLNVIMAFVSWFFPKIKFVAREANVLSVLQHYNMSKLLPRWLISFTYRYFDKLIAQSEDMKRDMIVHFGISEKKITLINNPVTSNYKLKNTAVSKPVKFITIGRLSKEKGYDRLLQALSKLSFPFMYTIIGDGAEKETLFGQAKHLHVFEHITHIPYTAAIETALHTHDIFLQGSYVEGFPNVLLESCSVGTPIVAFDAPGGLNEIIEHGKNGFIAKNEQEFINHLENLNESFSFTPAVVSEVVKSKFDTVAILKKYQDLFLSL